MDNTKIAYMNLTVDIGASRYGAALKAVKGLRLEHRSIIAVRCSLKFDHYNNISGFNIQIQHGPESVYPIDTGFDGFSDYEIAKIREGINDGSQTTRSTRAY